MTVEVKRSTSFILGTLIGTKKKKRMWGINQVTQLWRFYKVCGMVKYGEDDDGELDLVAIEVDLKMSSEG